MVIFLTPNNQMISKTVNLCHHTTRRWSIKWSSSSSSARKTINKSSSSLSNTTSNTTSNTYENGKIVKSTSFGPDEHSSGTILSSTSSSSYRQYQKDKKGKFRSFNYLKTKWSWKASAGWTILSILDWWLLATGGGGGREWFSWSSILFKWTPIGICMCAAIDWHLHNQKLVEKGLPRTASNFQTNIYCSLPLRFMSRCWGWLADCTIPETLRPIIYGLYCYKFNVNMEEAANPDLKTYKTLSEFFTRPLKDNVRLINNKCSLVSPADGTVLNFGLALNSLIEQVKGVTYKIDSFLGPDDWIEKKKSNSYIENIKLKDDEKTNLYQCVIYLAPGDYHRFHSPVQWEPQLRRHFIGELLSVNPRIAEWLPGLFCLNERVTYIGKWDQGFFSFTAVGATNVGSVQIYFDFNLKTNKWFGFNPLTHKYRYYEEKKLPPKIVLNKGELLGQFNMGSTIVLLFEASKKFRFSLSPGQRIRMGEPLGYLEGEEEEEDEEKNLSSQNSDNNNSNSNSSSNSSSTNT